MQLAHLSPLEKEEFLEGILNCTQQGIITFDAIRDTSNAITDFRYTYLNRNAENLLGRKASQIVGQTLFSVFPGAKEEGLLELYTAVVDSGTPNSFLRDYNRDGLSGAYEINVCKFRDGVILSFSEVSEQLRVAKNLSKLTERYEYATAAAHVGVWEYDTRTETLSWDNDMLRIYDVKAEEFTGRFEEWEKRVHPEDLAFTKAILQEAIDENKDYSTRFRIILSNGDIRWIDARARFKYDSQGKLCRMIGTNWDITELTLAYEELSKAKEKADQANTAKSEFLSVMSHELRTPLNPIIGLSSMLKETVTDSEERAAIQVIEDSGLALLGLISDILDFCSIEEGSIQLLPVLSDVHTLTSVVIEEMRSTAQDKGLDLYLKQTDSEMQPLMVDPRRYQQVLRRLVSNAIKFTESGMVLVTIRSDKNRQGSEILLVEVSDTGVGIEEQRVEHIFDHFTQVDYSSTRTKEGAGLGLAICRRLSRLMGGDITVRSSPGQGSTFIFELPCVQSSSVEPESRGSDRCNCENTRALLVDDDEHNLYCLSANLQRIGVNVVSTTDPYRAQEIATKDEFDIFFLDLHMPGLSGMDLAKSIRKSGSPNTHKRIVAVTADARPELQEHLLQHGFDRVITKPFRREQLYAEVCELPQDRESLAS